MHSTTHSHARIHPPLQNLIQVRRSKNKMRIRLIYRHERGRDRSNHAKRAQHFNQWRLIDSTIAKYYLSKLNGKTVGYFCHFQNRKFLFDSVIL